MGYRSPYTAFLAAILALVVMLLSSAPSCEAKRSVKEWEEVVSNDKLREQFQEEDKLAEESLGMAFKAEKPAMVFATFPPGTPKHEMTEHTRRYQGMLQSGAIRTSIFQSAENQWCITAYRTNDAWPIMQFLHEQPEVMKATYEYQDLWQLRAFLCYTPFLLLFLSFTNIGKVEKKRCSANMSLFCSQICRRNGQG